MFITFSFIYKNRSTAVRPIYSNMSTEGNFDLIVEAYFTDTIVSNKLLFFSMKSVLIEYPLKSNIVIFYEIKLTQMSLKIVWKKV